MGLYCYKYINIINTVNNVEEIIITRVILIIITILILIIKAPNSISECPFTLVGLQP